MARTTSSCAPWQSTTPMTAPPPSPSSAASCARAERWWRQPSTRPWTWLRKGGSYFDVKLKTDIWHTSAGDEPVRFWREPLSDLCTAATDAGFLVEKVIEPRPADTVRERCPDDYEKLTKRTGVPDSAAIQAGHAASQPRATEIAATVRSCRIGRARVKRKSSQPPGRSFAASTGTSPGGDLQASRRTDSTVGIGLRPQTASR
jgi:hypothetical protein